MATAFMLAGLPGSGKSHLLKKINKSILINDDVMAGAANHRPLRISLHYGKIIKALWDGKSVLISDIKFYDPEVRKEAEEDLRRDCPRAQIKWIYFRNDPDQCRLNVKRRARATADGELTHIAELSKFPPPKGIEIPVWKEGLDVKLPPELA